jgi:hypothetical protein
VVRSTGYSLTDSAGILAPGTKGPGFTESIGGGSIGGYYDASWLLPYGQGLQFKGFFNYSGANLTLGSFAGGGASAGSARFNSYTFGGKFLYEIGRSTYVEGIGTGSFGNGNETISVDGSSGSFTTQGYTTDLRVGTIVPLFATGGTAPTIVNKSPTRPAPGSVVAVDFSAHVGYANGQINGFTDNAGFTFGSARTQFGVGGAKATLFSVFPFNGWAWMPYVAGTVDQLFSYSSTLNIPAQAALPGGDVVNLSQAQTFGGGELGLEARTGGGWTMGVKGFAVASSDTTIAGGSGFIRIPLNYAASRVSWWRY